jgi:cytochrome P450
MAETQRKEEVPACLAIDAGTRRVRLDPHAPEFVQDPYAAYAVLHAVASTFFWEEYGFWCLGGMEDVSRVLRDRRLGRQKPPGKAEGGRDREHLKHFDALDATSMIELEPPAHTRLRTLVNRAFVSRQVERLRPRIEALANELIDRLETEPVVDLVPAYATPIPVTVIADMLGVPQEMAPRLLDWSHRMVAMYMHGRTEAVERSADAAAREFTEFLRGYVAERRRRPGDDLLSVLIAAQADGQSLTDDELISSVILLLNAGHEATVHQIGNAVRCILKQGSDPRRFIATGEMTEATVEECLRHDAPLHMFTRYAYEPVDLGAGAVIAPGEQVGLLLAMANRDPRAFRVRAHSIRCDRTNGTSPSARASTSASARR